MPSASRRKARLSVHDLEGRLAPALLTAGNIAALTTIHPAAVSTPTPQTTTTPKAVVTPAVTAAATTPAPPTTPIRGNGVVYETVRKNWGTGATIDITIKNDSTTDMFGWRVEFDAPFNITQTWNAQLLSQVGSHYVFKNIPNYYNAVIKPGTQITFGFNTAFDPGTPTYISAFTLNGKQPDTGGNVKGSTTGTVGQVIRSNWGTGATSDITVRNTGSTAMQGWTVEFDAAFTITDVWNAQLVSHSGNHYVFQNIPGLYNALVPAHGAVKFGFNAVFDPGTAATIQNVLLNGNAAGGGNTGGSTTGTVTQTIPTSWGQGATNNITIKNTGTTTMKGWTVEFDAPFAVAEVWNAQLISTSAIGNGTFHYVFQSIPGLFNANIPANGTATFGFNAAFPAGTNPAITNVRLNGASTGGSTGAGGNTGGSKTGTLTQTTSKTSATGATINLSVQNTGTSTMNGWTVEFDAPFTVTDSWNAQLVSHTANPGGGFHYVFQNIPGFWNANIPAGGTISFGFNTTFPTGTTPALSNGKLNGTAVTIGTGGDNNNNGGSTSSGTVLQTISSEWSTGNTSNVTIRNTGTSTMSGWTVEFDASFTVTGFWNATLVSDAQNANGTFHYVFQSTPGSAQATIPVGGTTSFGFNTAVAANGDETMLNTKLNGVFVGNDGAGGTNNFTNGSNNGGGNNGGGNTGGSTTGTVLQVIRTQSPTGSTNDITIKNTGTGTMTGWTVEFDAPFTVTDVWNASLVSSASIGNGMFHYVIQNTPGLFNANIPANGTGVFGFNTTFPVGTDPTMLNTKLNGVVVGNNGAGGTTDLGTGGTNTGGGTGGSTNQNFTANVTETAQDFGPGSTNNLTIHNTGTTAIDGWTLAFDAPFTITQTWNATLVSSTANPGGGYHYVFNNIPNEFNANIPAGGTATFGFNTQYAAGTTTAAVTNITLNGKAV